MTQCLALIMAAGFAGRFGSDKRWAVLPDGKVLIEQVFSALASANICARFVLRDNDEQLSNYAWPVPSIIVASERAERGLGASVAAAAQQVPNDVSLLICLADMPCIHCDTYRAVANAIEAQGISVPTFNERRGHPVGFSAYYLPALRQLDGDEGARNLLSRYRKHVKAIAVNDAGIHRDIDTHADLLAMYRSSQ